LGDGERRLATPIQASAQKRMEAPGEGCDLDYVPHTSREGKPRISINNSFGVGGHNATLVLGKFEG
jgi:3-oxoacyl-[acyl-carrier-protein] synthase II